MTVYVDDMYLYPLGQFGRMKMSHMFAEDYDELHEMADKIGLLRKWFQKDHYDVSISLRREAIRQGAIEVELRTAARMMAVHRKTGRMPTPEEIVE